MRKLLVLSGLALGLMAAPVSHAQDTPTPNDAWHTKYQADLAQCAQQASPEAAANCRRDARAAYETARKGELSTRPADQLQHNAIQRCNNLPAAQREGCLLNMKQGANTQVSGSVSGGGILRRTEITIPAEPAPSTPSAPNPTTPQAATPEPIDTPASTSGVQ